MTVLLGCQKPTDSESQKSLDITVTVDTTGFGTDSDGFSVRIGDRSPKTISPGERVVFSALAPGSYDIRVSDIAPHCRMSESSGNPKTVELREDSFLSFLVKCVPPHDPSERIVFESDSLQDWDADNRRSVFDSHIYIVRPNGSGLRMVLGGDKTGYTGPSLSPDGQRLAYWRIRCEETGEGESEKRSGCVEGIYTSAPDGTDTVHFADGYYSQTAWSPDGTRLAYTCAGGGICSVPRGGGATKFHGQIDEDCTENDLDWSPDGDEFIVACRYPDGATSLYRMTRSGALTLLADASSGGEEPDWAPVSEPILISRKPEGAEVWDIYGLDPSSGEMRPFTRADPGPPVIKNARHPVWTPHEGIFIYWQRIDREPPPSTGETTRAIMMKRVGEPEAMKLLEFPMMTTLDWGG